MIEPEIVEDLTSSQMLDGLRVLVGFSATYGNCINVNVEGAYIGDTFVEARFFAEDVIERWESRIAQELREQQNREQDE